jgi:hypothetical protein
MSGHSWPDEDANVFHAPLSAKAQDVLRTLLGYLSQFSPVRQASIANDTERRNTFLITICGTSIVVAATNEFLEMEDASLLGETLKEWFLAETMSVAGPDRIIVLDDTGVASIRR